MTQSINQPIYSDDWTNIKQTEVKTCAANQRANSQHIYDNPKTYIKTDSYGHLLDVLRQLGSNSQIRLFPIVIRFILRNVIR